MMMMNGLAIDGGYTTEGGDYIFESSDASGPTSGTFTTTASSLDFADQQGRGCLRFLGHRRRAQATPAMMPMPITVDIAEYGLNFEMPLSRSEGPAPWAAGVNLTGLDVSDDIWAMFDPSGMLSHDPATLRLDLTGTATMLFDAMDPAQAEAMAQSPMPLQVESANLNDLTIAFGGAEVTGSGAFTFDNTDLTTIPGMPKTTGAIDLQLNGVNALVDTLAAMGLHPAGASYGRAHDAGDVRHRDGRRPDDEPPRGDRGRPGARQRPAHPVIAPGSFGEPI
jgi:hypothetical protein